MIERNASSNTKGHVTAIAFAAVALLSACKGPDNSNIDGPGPALSVTSATLDSALNCSTARTASSTNPVLLVHGTGSTADESWSGNYQKILPELGYNTCILDLPNRALGDVQISAEYVVAAIRSMSRGYERRVNVMSHSQGALEVRWALKYWPDMAGNVDDFVSLAASNHGTPTANAICLQAFAACTPSVQQQRPASTFLATLNTNESVPAGVSYTSIYSLTDEIVTTLPPNYSPAVNGATNILVQDVCPLRLVTHLQELTSGAVYYLVLDAFTHAGTTDVSRIDRNVACLSLSAPGVTINDFLATNGTAYLGALISVATGQGTSEPTIASYAATR